MNAILPRPIDNTYRGHRLGFWLLIPVVFAKAGMGLGTIFNGRWTLRMADAIPLERFGPEGAQSVVALFAIWGLAHLVLAVFGLLALTRYRSMIPLIFVSYLAEFVARRGILAVIPLVRTGTPSGMYVNLAIMGMMILGLALSLRGRQDDPALQ